MDSLTIGLVVFFSFYCFLFKKLSRDEKKMMLPPGPCPWPLIGSLHLLGNLPHHSLATLAKKYGPIMSLRLGFIPTVVLSSPAMAKEFLKTHDLAFATRPNCTLGKYVCYYHHNVLFSPCGVPSRQVRKLCMVELLTVKRIESFRFVREEEVSAIIASIWRKRGHGEQCVDLKKSLSTLTQNITCRMFSSMTYSNDDLSGQVGFKQMVEEIFAVAEAFCIGDFVHFLDWFDIQGILHRMEVVHKIFDGFADKVIEEHIHRRLDREEKPKEENGVKDMVDVLLDTAEMECQTISRVNIKGIILVNKFVQDMLAARIETSSTIVEWAMSELLRNPAMLA